MSRDDSPVASPIGEFSADPSRVPLVTIGMPVYNGARYLEEAVRSLLNQTERDFVLLISDNCSTDATPEICARLAAEDHRVSYVRQEVNMGAPRNFEHVLRAARSPFFMWAAHDDLWDSDFMEVSLRLLREAPNALGCAVGTRFIDESGAVVGTELPPSMGDQRSVVRAKAIKRDGHYAIYGLFRRDLLTRASGIPDVVGGDVAFMFSLALRASFATTKRVLWSYRGGVDPRPKADPSGYLFKGSNHKRWLYMLSSVAKSPLPWSQKMVLTAYLVKWWLRDMRRAALYDSPQRVRRALDERRYFSASLLALSHAVLRPSRAASELRSMLDRR